MQTATVFNIQKFSLNDGPGIRTVVFLKGCPLRCAWCSNPESQQRAPQLEWKESACVGCGACLAAAPNAKAAERAGKRHIDVRTLRGDAPEAKAAVAACPARALTCTGETKTVDEVLRVCLQDQPFYEDSGGGVTLSGGEALTWPDFCEELLGRLRDEGIDTCIETEAHVSAETYLERPSSTRLEARFPYCREPAYCILSAYCILHIECRTFHSINFQDLE